MGSEYTIVDGSENESNGHLHLAEMSNKFDLSATDGVEEIDLLKGATPEKLVDVAFKIIQVAAYWEGGRKLRDQIEKKLADIYFLDD